VVSINKSLFPVRVHQYIYFACLAVMAAAMPTSYFVTSLSQILMGANWLLEGNYREKLSRFSKNIAAWMICTIYMVMVVGLIWTDDLAHGAGKELIDRLPMLTLTFMVISSRPLSNIQIKLLAYTFFASVVVTSIIGIVFWITGTVDSFRKISPFVSHIYFSMMVVMTIFSLPWLTAKISSSKKYLYASLLVSAWLFIFLFILRSLTGIICFAGVFLFLLGWMIYKGKQTSMKFAALIMFVFSVLFGVGIFGWMYNKVSMKIIPDEKSFHELTAQGNTYTHDFNQPDRENGHFVYYFIADNEARESWNKISSLDYDGEDRQGNELRATLFRYLSSKGLRKDANSINKLTTEELEAIEKGVPNYLYTVWPGFVVRLHQTAWELYWYRAKGNPTGHTFTQRLELWKGSWVAFKKKPLIGWGTGDIFIAVDYGLHKIESRMETFHMKPHNQYLIFLLTLGLIGTIIIFSLYALVIRFTGAWKYLPFNFFLVIMAVSMIANHPIDAQAGQSFFTFFTLYFGFLYPRLSKEISV
jgi:hypothetical protein